MRVSNVLRLLPLVLVTVAVVAFSQDRYSTVSGMSNITWYGCARPILAVGNGRINRIEESREQHLANAAYNMTLIDNYDPSPNYIGPRLFLRVVFAWLEVQELVESVFETVESYDREEIIANVNAHYDRLKVQTDLHMRNATEDCAEQANNGQRAMDQINGMAERNTIEYGIKYLGLNNWMAWPTRAVTPKVTVIGPLEPEDEERKENDAG